MISFENDQYFLQKYLLFQVIFDNIKRYIVKIIRSLNVKKPHGHDNISLMRLLKCFHAEVGKTLPLIFENLAHCMVFPNL